MQQEFLIHGIGCEGHLGVQESYLPPSQPLIGMEASQLRVAVVIMEIDNIEYCMHMKR